MRRFAWLIGLFATVFLCAELAAAEPPYNGTWNGTIGSAKVQVYFSEDGGQYYYLKHKEGIRLERNKDSDEWKESIRRMQISWDWKTTGTWKLNHIAADHLQGIWTSPDTGEQLPIDLKFAAAVKKNNEGIEDMSAFYAPLLNSLQYSYKTGKFNDSGYKSIETEAGTAFELSSADKKTAKLNEYIQSWLKEQAMAAYGCKMDGGENWQRTLTPQYILGNFLVIEDNLPDTFCGGAHGTWSHTHLVYDLNKGDFADTRSWIKDFEKTSFGDSEGKTKFREFIESLNSRSEEDNNYFSLDAPYPTKEGLVFFTSHPYVSRACDEDILVPYKDLGPYLTPAGKKALSSFVTVLPSLTDAVSDKDTEGVRSLIATGANVNAKDIYDMTALEIAVSKGYMDIAKLLISKGADINVKDKNGETLLNRALKKGTVETARFIIEQGADVNVPDSEGVVPLTISLSDKNLIVLAGLIISKGADIKKKDEDGYSFLDTVLFNENIYDDKYKALRALSTRERLDIARALVAKGADVNEKDLDGNSCLHRAVSKGNIEIIKFLLENKADVGAKNNYFDGETALYIAIKEKKSIEIIKLLIAKGADVNTKGGQYGYTLLSMALGHPDYINVMQLLIKNGADVNLTNGGWTPLHIAAGDGLTDAVELLIQNGARINIWTTDEDSVSSTPLHWAVHAKHIDTVGLLINKGADINAITKNAGKETALHSAVYLGSNDIARLLVGKGANVDIKDSNGDTPLQWAANKGNMDITELLLKSGADINTKNNHGDTPLHTAISEKNADVARLLIEKGADVNAKDQYGATPLRYATLRGLFDIAKLLIAKGAHL